MNELAIMFTDKYRNVLRYDGGWLVNDDGGWKPDETMLAFDMCRSFAREKMPLFDGLYSTIQRFERVCRKASNGTLRQEDVAKVVRNRGGYNRNNRLGARKRFMILKRDNYRCNICGDSAAGGARLEVDHKVPVSQGGSNESSNLWTLCHLCNAGKSDRDL